MKYTNVIFDLDGTLLDSGPGIIRSLRHALSLASPNNLECINNIVVGPPIHEMVKKVLPDISADVLTNVVSVFRQHYDSEGWRDTMLYDGAMEILDFLSSKSVSAFIATNKPAKITSTIISELNIAKYFMSVASVDVNIAELSNKEKIVEQLIVQNQIEINSCLLVGDTAGDAKAAFSNCIDFVFAEYGYGGKEKSVEFLPTVTITSLPELKNFFENDLRL